MPIIHGKISCVAREQLAGSAAHGPRAGRAWLARSCPPLSERTYSPASTFSRPLRSDRRSTSRSLSRSAWRDRVKISAEVTGLCVLWPCANRPVPLHTSTENDKELGFSAPSRARIIIASSTRANRTLLKERVLPPFSATVSQQRPALPVSGLAIFSD